MRFTAEQEELRALAHEFAERELRPRSAGWDRERALDGEVFGALAEVGFLGLLAPDAQGGLGLDPVTYLLILEELAWGDASVALAVAVHNGVVAALARWGTPEQRGASIPALAAGERLGTLAFLEPEEGAGAAAPPTTAAPDGAGGWRLSGAKCWVPNGARAGLALVLARTGPEATGAFLVELPATGWTAGRRETTMGLCAIEMVPVELDGVPVPAAGLLGAPDGGVRVASEAHDVGRLGGAAVALGVARSAQEHAVAYALEREQFEQPIARFGAVREKLAEMHRHVCAARALALEAAERRGTGSDGPLWPAMAKLTASEAATWVADEAVQVFGGYGYMRDYPVEKLMRDAQGIQIFEGTSGVLRATIARALLPGPSNER